MAAFKFWSNMKTAADTFLFLNRTHYSESTVFVTDLGKNAIKWVTQTQAFQRTRSP